MNKFELRSALAALDDTGIYPQARILADGTRVERTEWENGWNACKHSINKKMIKIWRFLETLPERCVELIEEDILNITVGKDEPELYVNCNDLFYWACSDFEEFELSNLPELEKALAESPKHGDVLWCCRQRGMRPQKPYYKLFTEDEVKLFDACGPERSE